jgi:hypothetical protein
MQFLSMYGCLIILTTISGVHDGGEESWRKVTRFVFYHTIFFVRQGKGGQGIKSGDKKALARAARRLEKSSGDPAAAPTMAPFAPAPPRFLDPTVSVCLEFPIEMSIAE